MEITRNLLTRNPFSRPGTYLNSVNGIVIHWVANPGTSAAQNRAYFESLKNQTAAQPARYASAHFIVGIQGEVLQCIPVTERAWHTGAKNYNPKALAALAAPPNYCTLGIELCHPDSTGRFTEQTRKTAAELCAVLCMQHNLTPKKHLYRHYDITGKNCPKYFVEHEDEWQAFLQEVEENIQTQKQ